MGYDIVNGKMCTELTILTPGTLVARRTQTFIEGNTAPPVGTPGATVVRGLEVPRHCENELIDRMITGCLITRRPDPITSVEGYKSQINTLNLRINSFLLILTNITNY